jgi:aerobic carbon-monoxide dehydrogenase medium subunit
MARSNGPPRCQGEEAQVIPGRFEYHRPASLGEAIALLAQHGEESRVLAGGHSLIPMMKLRLAQPSHLVDLQSIAGLKGIREEGGAIVIGAMTTQAELLASELVAAKAPVLHEAARLIADPQVRYCGTIGGNVANGDPGNDLPALMMALGATYVAQGAKGERRLDPRQYYQAPFQTALGEGEILTAIRVPVWPTGHGYAYEKMKRKVGDYATAGAAVLLEMSGGSCKRAAIALTNVAGTPVDATAAAKALEGSRVEAADIARAGDAAMAASDPVSDLRGPVEFRRHVAGVVTRRAIVRALQRAGQGGRS